MKKKRDNVLFDTELSVFIYIVKKAGRNI